MKREKIPYGHSGRVFLEENDSQRARELCVEHEKWDLVLPRE